MRTLPLLRRRKIIHAPPLSPTRPPHLKNRPTLLIQPGPIPQCCSSGACTADIRPRPRLLLRHLRHTQTYPYSIPSNSSVRFPFNLTPTSSQSLPLGNRPASSSLHHYPAPRHRRHLPGFSGTGVACVRRKRPKSVLALQFGRNHLYCVVSRL
jgi:hypothetical protein